MMQCAGNQQNIGVDDMIAHASLPFPARHALDHSSGLPFHFSDRVSKKLVRPVLDAAVLVHFKPLQSSALSYEV
jgi:hypothetical protein